MNYQISLFPISWFPNVLISRFPIFPYSRFLAFPICPIPRFPDLPDFLIFGFPIPRFPDSPISRFPDFLDLLIGRFLRFPEYLDFTDFIIFSENEQTEETKELFEKLMKNAGRSFYKKGENQRAIACFREVLAIYPNNLSVLSLIVSYCHLTVNQGWLIWYQAIIANLWFTPFQPLQIEISFFISILRGWNLFEICNLKFQNDFNFKKYSKNIFHHFGIIWNLKCEIVSSLQISFWISNR